MLAKASRRLHDLGFSRVVVPSRRGPAPSACEWIKLDWRDQQDWGSKLDAVLNGPVDLLVAWVHYPYRGPLWAALKSVVSEATVVVEVWSHAGARPDEWRRLAEHPHSHVVLGRSGTDGEGWLDNARISRGVSDAVERALIQQVNEVTIVGFLSPADESRIREGLGFPGTSDLSLG